MQIKSIQIMAERFVRENATTLLTAGGVVGTVGTAIISFRAGMKAENALYHQQFTVTVEDEQELTPIEKAKIVVPHILPSAGTTAATVAAIIMANKLSAKQAAALAAAYGVSQKQLEEYKAKMAEKLGINKMDKARAEMAQERVDKTPGSGTIVIYGDEVLCFDEPTGRYFKGTMEKINRAANCCNQEIMNHGYAPASMFYGELDLPGTTWSDEVGWNQPFELEIDTVVARDAGAESGKPCITIDFKNMPTLDYDREGSRYS